MDETLQLTETIQLTVCPGYYKRFQCTVDPWDIGMPIGDGNTIQEAIEDFLQMWECKYDELPNYKWSC